MNQADTDAQRGYTMPELLIGMTLSLLVIAAATSAYATSKQTWNAMAAADAIHANARAALRNIRAQAHMAGSAYLQAHNDQGNFSVSISARADTAQTAVAGVNGSGLLERLTLGHWHALDATDCQGNTSSAHNTVLNDYKRNSNQELSCKDLNLTNSTYQALAEGVEDFQVRYAEFNPVTDTLQWKTANQVTDMAQVLAIEVCLRIGSVRSVNNPKPNANFKGCQEEALPADGRLRRTFKRVIALRNRDEVIP